MIPEARICGALALLALVPGCATSPRGVPPTDGIPNFGVVTPRLSRGAQPDRVALDALARRGVRQIVNLRMPYDNWPDEEAQARARGFDYVSLPLPGWRAPQQEQVEKILTLIRETPTPLFLHCEHGADRTGLIIACYRIREQGWTVAHALAEAEQYGMSPLQLGMKRFIRRFAGQTVPAIPAKASR